MTQQDIQDTLNGANDVFIQELFRPILDSGSFSPAQSGISALAVALDGALNLGWDMNVKFRAWVQSSQEWKDKHPVTPPLPPVPTREAILGVQLTFQGLTVPTQQYGPIKWFEPWLAVLSAADRTAVLAAKVAAGDKHAIIEFQPGVPIYNEPPFDIYVSPDFEANPQLFRQYVIEIIAAGLTPIVVFNGDNGDALADGYPNALRQLPILVDLFKDLNDRILYARLWDGVFYGSTPANITAFGKAFRSLLPNGYLAIEHNSGHIPVGNGTADYMPGGAMDAYDVIMSEFDLGASPHTDNVFQIVARCVEPYHRPMDQPAGDDPNPPFYLKDSPRGPRYYCAFEFGSPTGVYWWVRGQVAEETIGIERAYLKSLGCKYTG